MKKLKNIEKYNFLKIRINTKNPKNQIGKICVDLNANLPSPAKTEGAAVSRQRHESAAPGPVGPERARRAGTVFQLPQVYQS